MRTTLDLDENLIREVAEISGAKNKTDAIHTAMREYIRCRKLNRLLELRGNLDLEDNWKELREAELGE